MIEAAVYELLSGDTAIASIVGNRIYPLFAPQRKPATYPDTPRTWITYQTVSEVRDMPLNGPTGLVVARIQIDFFAYNYDVARSLADVVRLRLEGFNGSAAGHRIQRIWLDNRIDGYEFETEGSENPIVRVISDFRIAFAEAIAA